MDRGERTLEESLLVLGNLLQEEDRGVCLHLLMPDCNQTPQSVQEKERNFPPKKYGEIHHGAMPREGVATSTLFSSEDEGRNTSAKSAEPSQRHTSETCL